MKVIIPLKGLVYLFPCVSALSNLLLRVSRHMVYAAWAKVVIIYELVDHYSITMFLGWLQISTLIQSLKYCDHIVPNQNSVCNERVGECSNSFRITSKYRGPTDDWCTSNHLLIMCEILSTIGSVRGITSGGWSFQIITQSITEGLSTYF